MNEENMILLMPPTSQHEQAQARAHDYYWWPHNPYYGVIYGTFLILGAALTLYQDNDNSQLPWSIWTLIRGIFAWIGAFTGLVRTRPDIRKVLNYLYVNLYISGIILTGLTIYQHGGLKGLSYVCGMTVISVVIDTLWLAYFITHILSNTDADTDAESRYQIDESKVTYHICDKSESVCVVCLESYQIGDQILKLHCSHNYHSECIVPWLKRNGKCPVCRSGESIKND